MYAPNAAVEAEHKPSWQVISGLRRAPRRAVPRSWYLGLAALVLANLVLYVHTVTTEVQLNREQAELRQLKEQNTARRAYVAQIQNPRRIESVATRQLAMQEPKEVVYLTQPVKVSAPKVNVIPAPPAVVHEGF